MIITDNYKPKYPPIIRQIYLVSNEGDDITEQDKLFMELYYRNGYTFTPYYATTNNLPSVLVGHCENIVLPIYVFVVCTLIVHTEVISTSERFQSLINTLGFNCTRQEFEEYFYEKYFGKN